MLEGILCYEQRQLFSRKILDENFDDDSSMNSANNSNNNTEDSTNYEVQNSLDDIDEGVDLLGEKMMSDSAIGGSILQMDHQSYGKVLVPSIFQLLRTK